MPPRLLTSCSALPPEGAAAPAVWRSQSRGPCLKRWPRSFYSLSLWERAGVRALRFRSTPPRSRTACRSLPPKGAAAPVARQSRFHGPCSNGMAPSYSLSLRERAGASRCGSRSACALLDSVEKAGLRPACGLQDRAPRIPTLAPPQENKTQAAFARSIALPAPHFFPLHPRESQAQGERP